MLPWFVPAFKIMRNVDAAAGLKINIGAGLSGAAGWFNIDNSPTVLISRIPLARKLLKTPQWPKDVRRFDVRKGLPFPDQSAIYIYSSHTFEHFTWAESVVVAKECFRVLRPGGVVRIVVPDLELIVRRYLAEGDALAAQRLLQRLSLSHTFNDLIHPGANHSQMFDRRSLIHLLQTAGFDKPEVSQFMQSRIPEVGRLDLEQRKSESLYVESLR